MTRDEVIYALERCASSVPDACVDCSLWKENQSDYISCRIRLMNAALSLLQQEPKRGQWIDDFEDDRRKFCSNCNSWRRFWWNRTPQYCPDCGAMMNNSNDGGKDHSFHTIPPMEKEND